jgi:hypothetical protein
VAGNVAEFREKVTVDGAAATVVVVPDCPVRAPDPPPIVPVMVVASPAWLLGWKLVVTVPDEPVIPELGVTVAVNPAAGAVVTLKVTGTPGWVVLSLAVIVTAAEPAVYVVGAPVTEIEVPVATSYETQDGPGYDAGEEPASMMVVENVPVGGAAVAGDAVEAVMVPSVTVSVKPGAIPALEPEIVKVSAAAVAIDSSVRYVPGLPVDAVNAHPDGAKIVTVVIAYEFDIGLAIFSVVPAVPVAVM